MIHVTKYFILSDKFTSYSHQILEIRRTYKYSTVQILNLNPVSKNRNSVFGLFTKSMHRKRVIVRVCQMVRRKCDIILERKVQPNDN